MGERGTNYGGREGSHPPLAKSSMEEALTLGNSFTIGKEAKKTPFERHLEEIEEKKRKAEEEAAAVYQEFVDSFKDDTEGPKVFVKAGVEMGEQASKEKKVLYKPTPMFKPPASQPLIANTPEEVHIIPDQDEL